MASLRYHRGMPNPSKPTLPKGDAWALAFIIVDVALIAGYFLIVS